MPFSRASACMASRISRDIGGLAPLIFDQVRTTNLRIGDRDDAPVGGQSDLLLGGRHQLSREAPHRLLADWQRMTRAHPCPATNEPSEEGGLRQRTLAPGGGDLERVALTQIVQLGGDPLAHLER